MVLVTVNGKQFDWSQASINMAKAAGLPVNVIVHKVSGCYHPIHHAGCFCAVCRGQADGHIDDPCECGGRACSIK